ncbi:hypothetical protein BIV57_02580 [Mangrovactinospora gilvigrisea]|uniref:Uncharacterized protein n=1 Tax=Mangrovactinospora gilvigrisea TaxID=1428644 RepID=A0A1J7BJZ8_9ACTN|nr:hypothetical protein [Mangrovactinospora gilvigrisea]OIV39011.1 hypothetical protein BIV57_02580 [Mangrovactinospora gilvigrisea]
MTCFFDANHGQGVVTVNWSPQWGVPRPIQACQACAQRVETTAPPFYTPQQQGYPQQGGYPQAGGYPAGGGYPQQGYPQQGYPPPRRGHSTGALIGAGAAGLIGGALIGEALADDDNDNNRDERPEVVNNYYEDNGNDRDYQDNSYDDGNYGGGDDGNYDDNNF